MKCHDFYEFSAIKYPPRGIQNCIEAVGILLDHEKPRDWDACKALLCRENLFELLISFDLDNDISDTTMKELEQCVNQADFQPDTLIRLSWTVAVFCRWVRYVYNYQLIKKSN